MDVTSILSGLNDAQRHAVTSEAKHILLLAGAGSGKTRALVHRIAWLAQVQQIPTHSVLAVTFTNKAAREMRGRIEQLLQVPLNTMWVGTFHGIAHRLLKRHWEAAGLPQNFQILDSEDQLRLLKRLLKAMALDEERWPPKQMQWQINGYKDEGLRPQHIPDHGDPYQKTVISIYQAYEEACQRGGQVDFAELLLRAHELWLKNPDILAHYQQRFRYLLVDEFQDTNSVQYAWLRVLAGDRCGVMVVGDDDQSIYGWRGAKIENIQQFSKDFPGAEVIKLEQNYRSTATILTAANAVIANNPDRLGKTLWTDGQEGSPINLYAGFNEHDEARFIADQIERHLKEDALRSDIAILYRSNAQSRVLEEELLRAGIPYRIYGGQRFYERLEIKNAIAYMRLAFNRQDDQAFERVVNTPTRGIGSKTVDTLRQLAREQQLSLWRAAQHAVNNNALPSRAKTQLSLFMQLIDELDQSAQQLPLAEFTEQVLEATALMAFHAKEKGEKGRARVENLQELVSATRQFEPDDEDAEILAAFLDTAALDAGDTQASEHDDAVQLMTLHTAKGLEFPYVFLAGMEENLFPHKMSMEEPGRLEEERRLCYVGITRAMQQLTMTYAETRRLYGQENYNAVSRFVREIPADCIQEVRLKNTVSRPLTATVVRSSGEDGDLALGQRVRHSIFGDGVVLDVEGQGAHARVHVNFDLEGSKWLVASYANLEPA